MGWRIPTKGPRRISARRNASANKRVPHPTIIMKAPPLRRSHRAVQRPRHPFLPAQLLLTACGGFQSTSEADFLNWRTASGRSAEPRANHLRRRIAPREGAAVSSSLRCNCGRLSANCPHGFPAGGEQPCCRPHVEPGNPRAVLRDWLCKTDPRTKQVSGIIPASIRT